MTWPSIPPQGDDARLRVWQDGRALLLDQEGAHVIDPVALTLTDLRFACPPRAGQHDFADGSTILRVCGDRAGFFDAGKHRVDRVKLPLTPNYVVLSGPIGADRSVSLWGRDEDENQLEITINPVRRHAELVDREERKSSGRPDLHDRHCARRMGTALGHGDLCDAVADEGRWLAVRHGSLAVTAGDHEILRLGVRTDGTLPPRFEVRGGGGLVGRTEDDAVVRWSFGAASDQPTRTIELPGRGCTPGRALPGGNLVATCHTSTSVLGEDYRLTEKLVELDPALAVVAERTVDGDSAYVLVNGRPLTYGSYPGLPFLVTEWPGPPSTCGDGCAPLATYGAYRDFAVRVDAQGGVQVAGTLDPNALVCVGADGRAHPSSACSMQNAPDAGAGYAR